jgi:hypothetical protein
MIVATGTFIVIASGIHGISGAAAAATTAIAAAAAAAAAAACGGSDEVRCLEISQHVIKVIGRLSSCRSFHLPFALRVLLCHSERASNAVESS